MIGVVIVTYNNVKDIRECLDSLFKSTFTNFKVFLVDNNSADQTGAYVQKHFSKVDVLFLKKNLGFAEGNNLGIQRARKAKVRDIFLLNPDTIMDKNCLKLLEAKADGRTILQPLILIHNGKKKTSLINTTGGALNFLGFSYCGNYRLNQKTIKNDRDIALASGAAMFVPTAIVKKIGSFDGRFFMYHEDVDFSWRARLAGYNIRLVATAVVWHKYSFSKNNNKLYLSERNRLLFLYKNFSLKYLALILPISILNELAMVIYALSTGWIGPKIKSYFSILRLLRTERKFRKSSLGRIRKNESALVKLISPEISFSEVSSPLFKPYNILLKLYWSLMLFIFSQ